jgi:hypothetical protein
LALTLGIAFFGFRSFERWKREKIEEKKIDVAVEALAIAYESKYVFDHIRSPFVSSLNGRTFPESQVRAKKTGTAGDRSSPA